jgi:CheY-like chemotaxis protein
LLSNAAKFTDEGEISIDASLQLGPTGKPEVLIKVTDTGRGIALEDQSKLFQAFTQVDDSPTRKTGGSGLGLSISQRLVHLHGGQIGVQSSVGKGSVFYFTLPVHHDQARKGADGRLVLAIDDDPQVLSLYERYLHTKGLQVLSLTDPSSAIQRAAELQPFAILLDIMMPGLDGWQVLGALKANPQTSSIPVIICSIIEEQERGFSLGAADYLVKPILEDDMIHSLNRLDGGGLIRDVLIIDDDPNDLNLLASKIADESRYKPILAHGGEQGWDLITANPPDAVILDLFMPEMDGFKLLEKMRANPGLAEIPVIAVSGGELTAEQKQQLDHFGLQLISKNKLDEKTLNSVLKDTLDRLRVR